MVGSEHCSVSRLAPAGSSPNSMSSPRSITCGRGAPGVCVVGGGEWGRGD
jgi:hypothetical protein